MSFDDERFLGENRAGGDQREQQEDEWKKQDDKELLTSGVATEWRTVAPLPARRRFPWVPVILAFVMGVVIVSGVAIAMNNAAFFAPQETADEVGPEVEPLPSETGQQPPVAQSGTPVYPADIAGIVEKAGPAVVQISTEVRSEVTANPLFNDPFFREFFGENLPPQSTERIQEGMGSGFIISEDGIILTNQHVVESADKIRVTVEGYEEPFDAELLGEDFALDLAVLKIDAPKPLPYLKLGNFDEVRVGDWSIAIGNPFGLDHTVTVGVVSAMGRPLNIPTEDGRVRQYQNLMQTDTAINPGNSGGPLLNLNGEVIAINTAVSVTAQGIGFAIPSSTVEPVLDQLINEGKVVRPGLGVEISDVPPELRSYLQLGEEGGALVRRVVEGSPAEKAGLQENDLILRVDGEPVKDANDLVNKIQSKQIGDQVSIEYMRNGERQKVTVTLAEM